VCGWGYVNIGGRDAGVRDSVLVYTTDDEWRDTMRTMGNLRVQDWAKITPDLKWSLQQAARFPTKRVRYLEGGMPIWTALFTGGIRADVVIRHADGFTYYLHDTRIPEQWTGQMWTDFVVGIVQSPHVIEAGTLREWPAIGLAWFPQGITVSSPAELAMIAGRAPTGPVTPQPVIEPPPPPPPPPPPAFWPAPPQHPEQLRPAPLPLPSPYQQTPYQQTWPQLGWFQRVANSVGVSPTVLGVGAAAVVGLLGLAVFIKRKKMGKRR